MSLKNKVESLLFSSGRRMHAEEIAKLCQAGIDDVKEVLKELKAHYNERESSLMIADEGDFWKITVKEQFLPLVRKIVTKTELDKGTLETLAVIAFKYPVLQADVIKVRTNKAYDHMKVLEEYGYITRQKHGRTRLIKLTQKFFEYFDLPEDKLKEAFKDFEGIAKAIEEKEDEIAKAKEEQKEKAEELKKDIKKNTEIDLVDSKGHKKKLQVYEGQEKIVPIQEKLGELEIVDESPEEAEEEPKLEETESQEPAEPEKEAQGLSPESPEEPQEEADTRTELEIELEQKVDSRVEEILHPKEEKQEQNISKPPKPGLPSEEGQNEEPDTFIDASTTLTEEPKDLLEESQEDTKDAKEQPKKPKRSGGSKDLF